MSKFYITTAIPYVNAPPHIGHALEFIQTDVIARYHRLLGDDVLLLSGGDENALKNVQAAKDAEKDGCYEGDHAGGLGCAHEARDEARARERSREP